MVGVALGVNVFEVVAEGESVAVNETEAVGDPVTLNAPVLVDVRHKEGVEETVDVELRVADLQAVVVPEGLTVKKILRELHDDGV